MRSVPRTTSTGRRSTTPPTNATASNASERWCRSSTAPATAAAKCLADDLDALVVHLRYPTRHRRRWRSTNLLERSLAEVKRRTKVIGRFPAETSCLTLVWAVLDLYITHAKNGVRFSQLERQHLRRIRYAGSQPTTDEEVTAA
jgi:putative transposase